MSDKRPPKNFAHYVYMNDSNVKSFEFRMLYIDSKTNRPRKEIQAHINEIRHNKENYINTKYPDNKRWLNR
jgi:hypothetical protein